MKCDDLVYRKLKELVDDLGSWKRVAEQLGVHPTYVSNMIAGITQPSKGMCDKLGIEKTTTKTVEVTYKEKAK